MVSVIIPNYNHSFYLKKRIDSVLNQTYQDIEIILLDDKSADNSREIIELYRTNPKVSAIVYNENNSGSTFKQWQKGIKLAKGEYIWIAESDDWAENSFLQKSLIALESYDAVLNITLSTIVDKFDNILRKKDQVINGEFSEKNKFLENCLLYQNYIYNASMVLFRKDAINNSIWDEIIKYKYCGDWLFWADMIINNQKGISEVKEYLNYFRTHDRNVSNTSENKALSIFEGFCISRYVFDCLSLKTIKEFYSKWIDIWAIYRAQYNYSLKTDLDVLIFLLKQRPSLIFCMFIRLLKIAKK